MEVDIQKLDATILEIKKREKLSNEEIAEIMKINYSYLFKILKKKVKPGKKMFDAVTNLCKKYNLNPNEYIFLK